MEKIYIKAQQILANILDNNELSLYVEDSLTIPKPHIGSGKIKLIVLGQDPTVKNANNRKKIKTVLNLDKNRSVTSYLSSVCNTLEMNIRSNVYATNLYKNFFIDPPTTIEDIDIFHTFLEYWLPLLIEEIHEYPNIPVITLGEPILAPLLLPGTPKKVREYWGYDPDWKNGKSFPFDYVRPIYNKLNRNLFPFPHQPSIRKEFYKTNLDKYTSFMKKLMYE